MSNMRAMSNMRGFEKLTIRNFKGLKSLDLDGLGRLNIFLGPNDTGKTSVLEAVFLICGLDNMRLPVSIQNNRNYIVHAFDGLSGIFHRLEVGEPMELTARTSGSAECRSLSISAPYAGESVLTGNREDSRLAGNLLSSDPRGPRVLRYDATIRNGEECDGLSFAGILRINSVDRIDMTSTAPSNERMHVDAVILGARSGYNNTVIEEVILEKKEIAFAEYVKAYRSANPGYRGGRRCRVSGYRFEEDDASQHVRRRRGSSD